MSHFDLKELSLKILAQSPDRVLHHNAVLVDDDDRPVGVAAIMRDITERHLKEKQLRERLAELEAAKKG